MIIHNFVLKLTPMNHQQSAIGTSNKKVAWKPILLAGLVAGVLDGLAAVISTYLASGKGPGRNGDGHGGINFPYDHRYDLGDNILLYLSRDQKGCTE
jgi:hypothetical protein